MKKTRRISRFLSAFLVLLIMCSLLAGCGGGGSSSSGGSSTPAPSTSTPAPTTTTPAAPAAPPVYYYNSKPDQDAAWQALAKAYTAETDIEVKVVSPAANGYAAALTAELAKSDAPTLFDVNGYLGLVQWGDNAYDLSSSKVKGELTNDAFALKDGAAVQAVAASIGSFGLIFNKDLLDEAGYKQDDIMNFFRLRDAVNDITARKDDLGFVAFAPLALSNAKYLVNEYIANILIFHEYEFDSKTSSFELKGTFNDQFNNIINLYSNNSTIPRGQTESMSKSDAIGVFTSGKAAFLLGDADDYDAVKSLGDAKLGFLPLYSSAYAEDKYGLCTGSDKFWVVNKKAPAASIEATLDFLEWCVTSSDGVAALCGTMGLTIPYKKNTTSNALTKIADDYMAKGLIPMAWAFTTAPNQEWKDELTTTVLDFWNARGKTSTDVANVFRKSWVREYEKEFGAQ